jgi:hypothetical protein
MGMAVNNSASRGPDRLVDGAPVEAGDVTEVLAAVAGEGLRLTGCDGRVLQASRHRPVVSYRVSYEDTESTTSVLKIVIGKAYYRGGGAGTFELMRHLWARGFSDGHPLCITEPIAWIPETKVLLQGQAGGRPLYDHLPAPEGGITRVRAAGRWLAKLHAADPGSATGPLPARFETEKLTRYASALAGAHPDLAGRVSTVAEAAASALEDAGGSPLVITHGDYQPKNIYVRSRRTTVIDFDRHALAPPARDLAHFLGQCLTMSWVRTGSFERIAPWNQAFLAGYGGAAGPGVELLPAYLARTFLEILYYKLVVKPVADPGFAPAWLAQCEEWTSRELRVPPG